MSGADAEREEVNQALARLLAWPEMARSPQLARFLSYIVERRLDGEAQSIKAYSIAVDVFGRSTSFDPQADPIVRVQARRLRGLLEQYYRGPGSAEALRIQLPIGRYVPEFVTPEHTPLPLIGADTDEAPVEDSAPTGAALHERPRGHVTISWFVLLVLALGASALTYSLSTWEPRRAQQGVVVGAMQKPTLRIMEFQNLSGDATLTSYISALAIEMVTDFAPFQIVDVSLGGRGEIETPPDNADGYVLTGIVQREANTPDMFQFSAILTDLLTNNIVWNWSVTVPREQMSRRGGVEFVSQELLSVLGGTRGPLHARARALLERSNIAGRENFYLCAVLFSMYRTTSTTGSAERFNSCATALPEADRQNGNVVAALASITAETSVGGRTSTAAQLDRFRIANEMMAQALQAAPTSSFVWEQRARIHEAQGMHDEAEAAYGTALQLNPASVDAVAAHARHLALIGRLDEAIPAALRAIDSVPRTSVPDWFYCVPAMAALRSAQFNQAVRQAQSCARADVQLGSVLALLAAQGAGDSAMVAQQLARVLEVPDFRTVGIITQLRRRIADTALIEQIRTGLTRAGVPPLSLMRAY